MNNEYTDIDLKIDPNTGDLALSRSGQILYTAGLDTPPEAILRLAGTPPGGYARLIRVGDTVQVLDQGYQSNLPLMISSPSNDLDELQDELIRVCDYDGRLSISNVEMVYTSNNSVDLRLTYASERSGVPQAEVFNASL